mmetsp:Transcript_82894/g.258862  ORF Transcript_82894/g.258862 Transcript_82894/m.258862 type:complete len:277 (+) Transcript_82894:2-832(+)
MGMEVKAISPWVGEGPLPQEHEDQMQLGIRIITSAFQNKTHSLEQEIRGLRLTCEEQRGNVAALQKKNSALEVELVESHQRSQQLAEENKELFKTVAQLRRQLARLEGLKKSVLDSISDHQQTEIEHEDNRLYLRDDYLKGATPLTAAAVRGEVAALPGPGYARPASPPRAEVASYRTPSPPPAPASASAPASGGAFGADAGQQVDGKQFFRRARNSLSYEAFNDFLAGIKRLNNQQQTREETLAQARRIFGPEQHSLYMEFEQLLNRHAVANVAP